MKSKSILKNQHQEELTELIVNSRNGDTRAQFKLYALYSKAMYNICLRMLNRKEDAEDALQDAFCVIFDKLDSFRFESSFGWWVKKIVVNTCINILKRKHPALDFATEEKFHSIADEGNPRIDEKNLNIGRVLGAISLLPDGYRVIFSLYQLEGYDHTEISEILGISESTSKTQYMKARNKLKEMLLKP